MALFEIIAREIQDRIRSGQYTPGEKIPSIRRMAEAFGCNKLTVQKAYTQLQREGYLENRVGSGTFVRFPEKISQSGHVFDLKTAYISEFFFPHQKAREIFDRMFEREKAGVFTSTPVEGDRAFLEILGRQFHLPTRRMFVISGAQQGLDLTAKVFSARISDTMLFEDPTYPGAISLFKARHFVPMEGDGPNLSRLDRELSSQIQLFYTMPSVHNPTGISYSFRKKEAVAQRAQKMPFYIIEDDYLSEFQQEAGPRFVDMIPEKTIYIKSLSQTTAAGIRMGFMIVPEKLYEKFLYTKYTSDIVSPGILQKFLQLFIQSGAYNDYVAAIRRRLGVRKERLMNLIHRYPYLSIPHAQSGYSLWIRSEKPVNSPHLPWDEGSNFSFSPQYRNYFKISFMNLDDPTFDAALDYLGELFKRFPEKD